VEEEEVVEEAQYRTGVGRRLGVRHELCRRPQFGARFEPISILDLELSLKRGSSPTSEEEHYRNSEPIAKSDQPMRIEFYMGWSTLKTSQGVLEGGLVSQYMCFVDVLHSWQKLDKQSHVGNSDVPEVNICWYLNPSLTAGHTSCR
jgi:hypothetical protein